MRLHAYQSTTTYATITTIAIIIIAITSTITAPAGGIPGIVERGIVERTILEDEFDLKPSSQRAPYAQSSQFLGLAIPGIFPSVSVNRRICHAYHKAQTQNQG
jgi:hypothetical protein